ncbi:NAD-P-binding [Lecanosticta acicola]|uniref:NAD-P-binding n=1 Tax=Lecanosticta acicola TaxID=111012 RepID=A0AAI9E906_9PEZI|nr:NAD-P-binding [Lecanosticta acicola]
MSQDPKAKLASNGIDFTPTIHNDTYAYIDPSQFDLEGRAVFVTGASKGVGRDTAISYARAGASQIAIAARSDMSDLGREIVAAAKEAKKVPPEVVTINLDVTSEQSVAQAAKEVEQKFGRLDILVNNAGYLEPFVPLAESNVDEWWRVWEVNIKGVYLVTRALIPLTLKTHDSLRTILNVSSIGAHILMPGASGYQMGKLAILRLGEFLSADYADQGLISFGIHPGAVPTELAKGMPEAMHSVLVDQPGLSADTIVWLTAERREWLKGRYISATWDMRELLDKREKIEKEDLLKVRMDVGRE